jgi:hypothetical protein
MQGWRGFIRMHNASTEDSDRLPVAGNYELIVSAQGLEHLLRRLVPRNGLLLPGCFEGSRVSCSSSSKGDANRYGCTHAIHAIVGENAARICFHYLLDSVQMSRPVDVSHRLLQNGAGCRRWEEEGNVCADMVVLQMPYLCCGDAGGCQLTLMDWQNP